MKLTNRVLIIHRTQSRPLTSQIIRLYTEIYFSIKNQQETENWSKSTLEKSASLSNEFSPHNLQLQIIPKAELVIFWAIRIINHRRSLRISPLPHPSPAPAAAAAAAH